MRKLLLLILPIVICCFSCSTTKKVETIQTAITKKDTTEVIVVIEKPKIDSVAIVKSILQKVLKQRVDFSTFYAKIKIDFESANESKGFTAYLYMKKDSAICVRLVGSFLGITKEGVVAKITKDSVVVINKIEKTVQKRAITYLQEVTKIPFDFTTLQDILIGNPVFIDSNVVSYRNGDNELAVYMVGSLFKHLVSLDKADFKVLNSKLDDTDPLKNRTCNISFSNYENKNGTSFSTYRKISVAEKSKLDVWLDYKQYTFNEPLTYMFNIPKNYKKQ